MNRMANLRIHPFGLGERDESLTFFTPGDANKGTGSFVGNKNTGRKIVLEVKNGDAVVDGLDIPSIALVKIDVEGFEVSVLKGLSATLRKHRPVVFFEWSVNARGGDANFTDLFPDRYQFYQFSTHLPRMKLFEDSGYRLLKIQGRVDDANVVAIPDEQRQLFNWRC
jgi:hypothetical protein